MSKELVDPKVLHERGARGEKPPEPNRRAGFSHAAPGRHAGPTASEAPAEKGKQSVRPHKRELQRKKGN